MFPQDEQERLRPWLELADQHGVDLILCITSALRHGMLDEDEGAIGNSCADTFDYGEAVPKRVEGAEELGDCVQGI